MKTGKHRGDVQSTPFRREVAWVIALATLAVGAGCGSSLSQVTDPLSGRCAAVTCAASDNCHVAGTCDPATGRCVGEASKTCPSGLTCDLADGQCHGFCDNALCVASDLCHVAGTCDPATGQCSLETPKDIACPPASDLCHVTGGCDPATGQCSPETPKSCPGQTCDPTDGQCKSGVNLCANVTCVASDLCHIAGTCNPATGLCSPETAKSCPGQICDPTDGQCRNGQTTVAPQVARDLQISPPAALAMDTSGNACLAASISSTTLVSFDGHSVASNGGADVFLAKYDTTGHALWAKNYGDANDQYGTGSAMTADGTVAVIGNFSGQMTFGASKINSTLTIDFLAAVRGADGTGIWAKQFNDGSNGMLKAVAANPSSPTNRIAVCGVAVQAATDLVGTGASYGGGNDIVIAMFDSAGNKLWAQQIGTPSNEECDAVAIDDNGDLYAAGKFDGSTLTFGSLSPLTGPNNSLRKFLWVAKFNGQTGAALESNAFGGTTGQATPNTLAVDASDNVVVAGSFTSTLPFGGSTSLLTSAGKSDVFVAKLAPALSPIWSVRMGGTAVDAANSVAVTSVGDVLVTGLFNNTSTGAAPLTAASTTASDAFLLVVDAATGATTFAAAYGDAATQTGDAIAVNRLGANQFALAGTLNGTITFPAPAGSVAQTPGTNGDVFLMIGQVQ